jgi:broad specificity phosphatase PhoE
MFAHAHIYRQGYPFKTYLRNPFIPLFGSDKLNMKVILIRHAESEGNHLAVIQGDGEYPLSKNGKEQISKARANISDFDFVVASDLSRSINPAFLLTGRLDLIDERLRERKAGVWEGTPRATLEAQFPGSIENDDLRPVGFETEEELRQRIYPALMELMNRQEEVGLVVGHGATMRWLVKDLTGTPNRFKNLAGIALDVNNDKIKIIKHVNLMENKWDV